MMARSTVVFELGSITGSLISVHCKINIEKRTGTDIKSRITETRFSISVKLERIIPELGRGTRLVFHQVQLQHP